MRFKLDENLGIHAAELLRQADHDVATVPEQNLTSASDRTLIAVCRDEGRCLITLDLDFSNPLVFPPSDYGGIAVLRLPPKSGPDDLRDLLKTLIGGLASGPIEGKLWIIQRGRIREYQETEDS
ncbi:MAG: hypothetical protein GKR89_37505 [Candidatus Latescibacteria bacterium]|nr:hypothetical protein [Candidatus Latescibacterota bacterium]